MRLGVDPGREWRSDQGLLAAYDALFANAQLGEAGITYRKIRAAASNVEPRLVGTPVPSPLRVRVVHAGDGLVTLTPAKGQPQADAAREFVARDLAAEVVSLLTAGTEVVTRRRDGSESGRASLHPGHIAVLVRTTAMRSRCARTARGRRTRRDRRLRLRVRDRAGPGLAPAARGARAADGRGPGVVGRADLLRRLDARAGGDRGREEVGGPPLVAPPMGCPPARPGRRLPVREGQQLSRRTGPGARRAVGRALHDRSAPRRPSCSTRPAVSEGLGPTAMASWLGRRINDAERDAENEERARRLESDAEAVQVITIHRSKGLEFPIVLCPYMWGSFTPTIKVPVFHDRDNGNVRTIDVGRRGQRIRRPPAEPARRGTGRRLAPALRRPDPGAAPGGPLVGRAPTTASTPRSPGSLFDRDEDGVVSSHGARGHTETEVEAAFAALGAGLSVERVGRPPRCVGTRTGDAPPHLEAVGLRPSRWTSDGAASSYSGITSDLHEHAGHRERAGAAAHV